MRWSEPPIWGMVIGFDGPTMAGQRVLHCENLLEMAAHKDARELNELLHLVRLKIEEIHAALPAMRHASDVDESMVMTRFTTQWEAQAARR